MMSRGWIKLNQIVIGVFLFSLSLRCLLFLSFFAFFLLFIFIFNLYKFFKKNGIFSFFFFLLKLKMNITYLKVGLKFGEILNIGWWIDGNAIVDYISLHLSSSLSISLHLSSTLFLPSIHTYPLCLSQTSIICSQNIQAHTLTPYA